MWNPDCRQNVNAGPLKEFIKSYELIVNNDTNFPPRPSSLGISIIDLALTSSDLGLLRIWEIPEEYPSLSDYELILMKWEDIDILSQRNNHIAISGWSIKNLLEDNELLEAMQSDWKRYDGDHQLLDLHCAKQELDKEVEWFEKKLTELLNKYAKITQITSYSKRWWNKKVAKARSTWVKDKRRLDRNEDLKEELKQARNQYFRTIRKAK